MRTPVNPRLLHLAVPYLAVCGALGSAAAICAIAQAWLLAHAVATVTLPAALFAVFGVRALLGWAQETVAAQAAARVRSRLRMDLLERLLVRRSSGGSAELVTLVTRGVDALDPYFARYLPQLLLAVVVPVAVLVALLFADLWAALVVAVTLPLVPVFGALIGAQAAARTRRQWRTLEVLAGHFSDMVAGLPTLKVFGRAHAQAGQIARITDEHRSASMGTLRLAFCSALVLELAATISVALVAVSVGLRLVSGHIALQTALFVLLLAPEAYLPLRLVGTHFHAAQEGLAAADRILALLDQPLLAPAAVAAVAAGRIECIDLVVRPGLAPVTLSLEPGTVTVLTGASGIGKSSLLAAVLGFAEPVSGRLTGCGSGEDWLRRIAWLPQRPFFMTGNVGQNIALAVPGASEAAVRRAAELTGVTTFAALTDPLGENGAGLSAGQRQRVALARAALRCDLLDVRLLLLDEPTAHLDPETELSLRAVIEQLAARARTTLVVTHRRALFPLADHFVRLEPAPASNREVVSV